MGKTQHGQEIYQCTDKKNEGPKQPFKNHRYAINSTLMKLQLDVLETAVLGFRIIQLWHQLPYTVRQCMSANQFKIALKTHLFTGYYFDNRRS